MKKIISVIFCLAFLFAGSEQPDLQNDKNVSQPVTVNFVRSVGSLGQAPGQFSYPGGMCIDENYIYVADTNNNRVQKFDFKGNYLEHFNYEHFYPVDIAVDFGKWFYILSKNNNSIVKYDQGLQAVLRIDGFGSARGDLNGPAALALNRYGDIYVVDENNNRIQKFSAAGEFKDAYGSYGSGDLFFIDPKNIYIDKNENIYVCDAGNSRITVYSRSWDYLYSFGEDVLAAPVALAIDQHNNIYVVDIKMRTILLFDSQGKFLNEVFAENTFQEPVDIAISENLVFILDRGAHSLFIYRTEM